MSMKRRSLQKNSDGWAGYNELLESTKLHSEKDCTKERIEELNTRKVKDVQYRKPC